VVIHHSGYQDPALRGRKLERDLRLLQLEDSDRPDDPFTLFNLGSVCNELGRLAEALPLLRRSLERSHPSDSIVRKLFALIVQCHRQLGQSKEALEACRAGRKYYPDDTELLFTEGMMLRDLGDAAGAEACLVRLLQSQPGEHFASVDAGLRGYKTRHNLAVLYREQGRLRDALAQWQTALQERPDFLPGWFGLAELHLAQGKWTELEQTAQQIELSAPDGVEAAVLRARGLLARKDFGRASGLMEQTVARAPCALSPRVVLSQVLLQEGRDWAAAERALRDVLQLHPNHAEAKQNLALLLQAKQTETPAGPVGTISRATYSIKLRDRTVDVPFSARGPADLWILHEVWIEDAYGVRAFAKPPQTVVDVGAHIGSFALMAAKAWPQSRIIACECDPENLQLLRQNVQGCPNVEVVEAAIVGDDVSEVGFNAIPDKFGQNSGSGSCFIKEPGSVTRRMPALWVIELWRGRNISFCDFLKLDCEGAEIGILSELARAGFLHNVGMIVGEWHALDPFKRTGDAVMKELNEILRATHTVKFGVRQNGLLGYFTAQASKKT
jgi:FkbM family methyltransferase